MNPKPPTTLPTIMPDDLAGCEVLKKRNRQLKKGIESKCNCDLPEEWKSLNQLHLKKKGTKNQSQFYIPKDGEYFTRR